METQNTQGSIQTTKLEERTLEKDAEESSAFNRRTDTSRPYEKNNRKGAS